MLEIKTVTGADGGECWVGLGEQSTYLFDTGNGFSADRTVENIKAALCGRSLDYILLTHSHFDHAGGLTAVKKQWPDAIRVSGTKAPAILAKDSARKLIRELDKESAERANRPPAPDSYTDGFGIDITLADGDTLDAFTLFEHPGHTRDCVSYWFPEEKLLVCAETLGVYTKDNDGIEPEFIVSYRDTLRSIDHADSLGATRLIVSHAGLFEGEAAKGFLAKAKRYNEQLAQLIRERHREGKTTEEILTELKAKYYDSRPKDAKDLGPVSAFLINYGTMIDRLIAEDEAFGSGNAD